MIHATVQGVIVTIRTIVEENNNNHQGVSNASSHYTQSHHTYTIRIQKGV